MEPTAVVLEALPSAIELLTLANMGDARKLLSSLPGPGTATIVSERTSEDGIGLRLTENVWSLDYGNRLPVESVAAALLVLIGKGARLLWYPSLGTLEEGCLGYELGFDSAGRFSWACVEPDVAARWNAEWNGL
ncbi:hypothetical protein [Gloeobacter kilaueensis]|uniref:Uncharacterized protein n=1 Tax=Gloeobacter kilaueensis (strain ATCC BAA-2537 / CCAP 1431/1 / ULC 316 / JS1) TaxID=1183438 RepID=U5QDU0_GLOK1|nr:hypothetical protein [Gloeobacter kilaueensis]AGY57033.1 hypothetical protein GKIL_0787 [Gloeobacter kilaueensis JS1]